MLYKMFFLKSHQSQTTAGLASLYAAFDTYLKLHQSQTISAP